MLARSDRKPFDTHRAPVFLCWYCSKQLPAEFTSVEKDGVAHRVHFGCRAAAAELVRKVDFDRLPAA